jgi:hypothetical protein
MYEITQKYSEFSEWYEVIKTVGLRLDGTPYRIEVIRRFSRQLGSTYDAFLWLGMSKDEPLETWEQLVRDTTFPWVAQDTPEGALEKAIGYLYRRHKAARRAEQRELGKV